VEPAREQPATPARNTNIYIYVLIAVILVGGAGYYIKIVRPKQQEANMPLEDMDDDELEDADDELPEDIEDEEGGAE
jgi:hypothetical protein